jgi:hypothetical protein
LGGETDIVRLLLYRARAILVELTLLFGDSYNDVSPIRRDGVVENGFI